MIKAKSGDKIYIPSSYYIDHPQDDVDGGIATINTITVNNYLPEDHYNRVFVSVDEIPNVSYNLTSLLEKQDKLKKEFKDKVARLCDSKW